jgi:circadian clock protein KaiC
MPKTRVSSRLRSARRPARAVSSSGLAKCPSGIQGLDDITAGGLPRGRPTLVCGSAGCGKTLMAMEFLVRGATRHGEPGVFVAFEETAEELAKNVASLGFDLPGLIRRKQLAVDHVRVERSEIEDTGEYDLEGLFVRLGHAIDTVGAQRVVLDTLESLFAGLPNPAILRAELRRLFRWLKERGVTTIITAERGDGTFTRHGLEEYVSDCVIVLDHRVDAQVSTRRLRIVKYRGSAHGTNEYPFLIDEHGLSVLPITSVGLHHPARHERVSSGVPALDEMLTGGFYRGSSVLISGTAGTGKTSLAAHFVDAACRRGERALYISFEESPAQLIRNMRSIGLPLAQWQSRGRLQFASQRATAHGLETHLSVIFKAYRDFRPQIVVLDPLTALLAAGAALDAEALVIRLLDYLKGEGVTTLCTTLTHGGSVLEGTELSVSSMIDTWLLLRDIELSGERNRGLYILKSRGMAHSNQIREFLITRRGVRLVDVYLGDDGVLTGSARLRQEARDRARSVQRAADARQREVALERMQQATTARMAELEADLETRRPELQQARQQEQMRQGDDRELRDVAARSRRVGGRATEARHAARDGRPA